MSQFNLCHTIKCHKFSIDTLNMWIKNLIDKIKRMLKKFTLHYVLIIVKACVNMMNTLRSSTFRKPLIYQIYYYLLH